MLVLALPMPALAQEAASFAELPELVVETARAAASRTGQDPGSGASVTRFGREEIQALPQGEAATLNQVLLFAPGVVQEAAGDLHVRGDHRNLQYRIEGIAIPEGISGFGALLEGRSVSSVSLVTGALPAQYGQRTAAVVDIRLRDGLTDPGGSIGISGGSNGLIQPGASYGGAAGGLRYFMSGNLLFSDRGLENPTGSASSLHNETRQGRGVVQLSYPVTDTTRAILIAGTVQQRFQIPNIAGQPAAYSVLGNTMFDSGALRSRQWNRSHFAIAGARYESGPWEAVLALNLRQTSLNYLPDVQGELLGGGVASRVLRQNLSIGAQGDVTWRLNEAHTLRAGFTASHDITRNASDNTVLPLSGPDTPYTISERGRIASRLFGLYALDEWRLTPDLTLNLGARFDHMDQQVTASQLSPRASLVWQATEKTSVSLGYARTFTPAPAELLALPALARYAGSTLQPEVFRNDPVRPERAHYINLGIRHRLNEEVTLGVELYHRTVRDMQDLGQFGRALVFSPYNYQRGRAHGVEFSAGWRRGSLSAQASLAISRSEGRGLISSQYVWSAAEQAQVASKYVRTDHDQLITGSAGASWQGWEGGTVNASLLYGSGMRRGFANSQSVTPYVTVNLGVSHRFTLPRAGQWVARLDVINLFDRRYMLRDGTGIGVGAPQYGLRRAVLAGLSTEF
ncbi:hypothetical protein EOD42_06970 [Rhodovarius crocodyli]|uniref:TonB-dependent receptor-like beta-barrel domain-containing protein n=1 Tax=Rhodovarius crocodyli TaxID=1979269 RepID=A0A437MIW0_9PROT|nr:TonB-dependent receptor [Rhodovarius crocodyli]RVT97561.1 hypothetical protein EOD42_06970 [Rhodovarius crocodyli]